ncbi:Triacylglycerol lipase 2 [Linum perenne]
MANPCLASVMLVLLLTTITYAESAKSEHRKFALDRDDDDDDGGICKSMVETQGYACEEHLVTTEDGYILGIQRMQVSQSGKLAYKPPVLVQHGLFSVSTTTSYYIISAN